MKQNATVAVSAIIGNRNDEQAFTVSNCADKFISKPILHQNMAKQVVAPLSFSWFFLLLLPGFYLPYFTYIHDPVMVPRFLLISGLFLAVLLRFRDKLFGETLSLNAISISMLMYYVVALVSILWVYNPEDGLFDAQKILLPVLTFVITTTIFSKNYSSLQSFYKSLLLLTCIVLVIAFIQTMQVLNKGMLNEDSVYEIKGFCAHRNLLAAYLFLLMGLNAVAYLNSEAQKRLHAISGIACLLFILLLQTRTELVALAISLLTMGWLYLRHFRNKNRNILLVGKVTAGVLMVMVVAAGVYLIAGDTASLLERLNPMNFMSSATAGERFKLWRGSFKMIDENFWLGVGAGNWKFEFPKYGLDRLFRAQLYGYIFVQPHNDFLWVFAETGVVGFFFFLFPQVMSYANGVRFLKGADDNDLRKKTMLLLLGLMAGFWLISSLDFLKERAEHLVIYGLLLALIHHYSGGMSPLLNRLQWRVKSKWLVAVLSLLLGLNVVMGCFHFVGQTHNMKFVIAQQNKDWRTMLAEAKTAENIFYKVDPVSMPMTWFSGMASYQLGDIDNAITDFEAALKRSPYSFHVLNNLGGVYTYKDRFDVALPLFRESVRINGTFSDALFNLAFSYYKLGQPDSASFWLKKISGSEERKKLFEQKIEELRLEQKAAQSSTMSN